MQRPVYDSSSARDCKACGHAARHDYGKEHCITCHQSYDVVPRPRCTESDRLALDMEAYATWLEQERDERDGRISFLLVQHQDFRNCLDHRRDEVADLRRQLAERDALISLQSEQAQAFGQQINDLYDQLAERDGMVRLTVEDANQLYLTHAIETLHPDHSCDLCRRVEAAIAAAQPAEGGKG